MTQLSRLSRPPGHSTRNALQLCAALLGLAVAGQAHAGSCTVSSPGLAFGPYQTLTFAGKLTSAAVTSNAGISVVCAGISVGGAFTIGLGSSTVGSGGGINTRYLANTNGGDLMSFNVFTTPSYSTIWGDGVTGGSLIGGSIPVGNSSQTLTVYGRIPAGQRSLKAGSFSDSLIMTVTYEP